MVRRRPKIVVVVLAYRHERFIADALRSIVDQQVEAEVEVLVGEDGSPDATRARLLEVAAEHPEIIVPVLRDDRSQVLWINGHPTGRRNLVDLLERADGDYIAFLDGDDRWIDPHKLSKQVAALQAVPEASGCFGRMRKVDVSTGQILDPRFPDIELPPRLGQRELIVRNPVNMGTMVWRRAAIPTRLPYWYLACEVGDFGLHALAMAWGPYLPLDDVLGEYRITGSGVWTGRDARRRLRVRAHDLALIEPALEPALIPEARRAATRAWHKLAWRALRDGDPETARDDLRHVPASALADRRLAARHVALFVAARLPGASPILTRRGP